MVIKIIIIIFVTIIGPELKQCVPASHLLIIRHILDRPLSPHGWSGQRCPRPCRRATCERTSTSPSNSWFVLKSFQSWFAPDKSNRLRIADFCSGKERLHNATQSYINVIRFGWCDLASFLQKLASSWHDVRSCSILAKIGLTLSQGCLGILARTTGEDKLLWAESKT